jgi:hypothetical protein
MNHIESPRTDDSAIEQEIKVKGLTAPRITPQDLNDNIDSAWFFTADQGVIGCHSAAAAGTYVEGELRPVREVYAPTSLMLLTFCVLVLKNGFTVTGESACASPENFDAEVGRKIALENAKQKIWPLMGYALKQELYEELK